MVSVFRPGDSVHQIPGIGVRTSRRAVSSGAADWWAVAGKTCVAAYQPKGAASYAASKVNLASPGTDITDGTAYPSWSAAGWAGNGNSQYLKTGIVRPSGVLWSALVRYSSASTSANDAVLGTMESGAGGNFLIMANLGGSVLYAQCDANKIISPNLASGVLGIAGNQAYRNGNADGTTFATATARACLEFYIFARNNQGTPDLFSVATIAAVAIYSDVLTAGEMATVSAAMAAL